MRFVSILIGKTILKCLRLMGRSGSALPGLVVEKLNPKFLNQMLGKLPQGVVVITGTNGKTTTTMMATSLLEAQGLRVLTNKTGSNFVRGTVTTVIDKASWSGKLPYDIAIFEQDEAHAVHFVRQCKPRGVAVLNIMRDQMDRFGEIDTTAKLLQKVTASATDWLVLNANDERVSKMAQGSAAPVIWYGHSEGLQHSFLTDDELHHQDSLAFLQSSPPAVELKSYSRKSIMITTDGIATEYALPMAGSHNAINLTAALAVQKAVLPQADLSKTIAAVSVMQPAFGRGEVITLDNGSKITLQLVKNPGGFAHALRMLDLQLFLCAGFAINDDYADGRDVSWLWDVDFNLLQGTSTKVLCGGTRGHDMAVRLKYDSVKTAGVELDLEDFVNEINRSVNSAGKTAIIFCTYTAMLKIRAIYKKNNKSVSRISV